MRARDAVGKRIVKIHQTRHIVNGYPTYNVEAIELENGTLLCPVTVETDHGAYYVENIVAHKRARRKRA